MVSTRTKHNKRTRKHIGQCLVVFGSSATLRSFEYLRRLARFSIPDVSKESTAFIVKAVRFFRKVRNQ